MEVTSNNVETEYSVSAFLKEKHKNVCGDHFSGYAIAIFTSLTMIIGLISLVTGIIMTWSGFTDPKCNDDSGVFECVSNDGQVSIKDPTAEFACDYLGCDECVYWPGDRGPGYIVVGGYCESYQPPYIGIALTTIGAVLSCLGSVCITSLIVKYRRKKANFTQKYNKVRNNTSND